MKPHEYSVFNLTACVGIGSEGICPRNAVLTKRGAVGRRMFGCCFDIVVWPIVGLGEACEFGVIIRTCVWPIVVVWLSPIGRICAWIFYWRDWDEFGEEIMYLIYLLAAVAAVQRILTFAGEAV